jgi:D-alanyl-D-alanine carboxypeptidase
MLIERVTRRPYGKVAGRRLDLPRTFFPGTDPRIPGPHMHAYLPDGAGGVVDITEMNPSVQGAAGSVVTTAADLNHFTTKLLGGGLLPPAELHQMKAGLGLEVQKLSCGRTAYGHSGDALGVSTWTFATDPDHAVTISVTWGTGRPSGAAVTTLIDNALCG